MSTFNTLDIKEKCAFAGTSYNSVILDCEWPKVAAVNLEYVVHYNHRFVKWI